MLDGDTPAAWVHAGRSADVRALVLGVAYGFVA
jgi:hypothetical protein